MELTETEASHFSMWARPSGTQAGSLQIVIAGEDISTAHPVGLTADNWRFTAIDIPTQVPVRIVLQAADEGASVALTRMQVRK